MMAALHVRFEALMAVTELWCCGDFRKCISIQEECP